MSKKNIITFLAFLLSFTIYSVEDKSNVFARFLYQLLQVFTIMSLFFILKKKIKLLKYFDVRSVFIFTFLIFVLWRILSLGPLYTAKIFSFYVVGLLFEKKLSADTKRQGVRAVLIFLTGCVYTEFIVTMSGVDISLHNLIFPMSRADGNLMDLDSVFRFSGWQVEPGYHSIIILILLLLEAEYTRLSKSKEINKYVVYLALTSVFLSGSILGILMSILWISEKYLIKMKLDKTKLVILLTFPIALFYIYPYFEARIDDIENYRSLNTKIDDLKVIFQRSNYDLLIGSGFSYESELHVKDLGFFLSNFIRFGVFGLIFSCLLLKNTFSLFRPKYTSIAIILTMKIGVLYLPFWIFFHVLNRPYVYKYTDRVVDVKSAV